MKAQIFTFVCFVLCFLNAQAQSSVTIRERIRFKDTIEVYKYKPEINTFKTLQLKMHPGDYTILNLDDLKKLAGYTITGVDLVYSDYPKGDDFSELNRKRILSLFMEFPEAFESNMVNWRLFKQTGVSETGGIQNYFHGLTIYYRPMPTYQDENKMIMDIVDGKVAPHDSTILKVLDRKKDWKNMLVVCDVTGSMSPYTAQLLFWIKSNQAIKSFKQIVFFNDNDEKSNDQKRELDTSGIWDIETGNSKKVIDKAFYAMQHGGHYENNLEAVFYAIKQYPENKMNVVMIADNWESPCDMALLDYLKKEKIPVRIIVCGVTDRLNTVYLDIAHATGGSVHTIESDLEEVAKIGEGKSIKFGKLKFVMMNGRFVQVK
jgi:hypothetical protein